MMVRVSSRASVIVKEWNIEPKQVKHLPDGWEKNPAFNRLFDGGFIWFVDSLGKPTFDGGPYGHKAIEPIEPLPEPEDVFEEEDEEGEEEDDWPLAEDYLQRNSRTVIKNLRDDDLSVFKLQKLYEVEKAKKKPRSVILKKLESMLK